MYLRKEIVSFIRETSVMLEGEDKTPVLDWLELACDLSEGLGDCLEEVLNEIYRSLCYVRNNFSPQTLQQSLHTCCLANEIIYGAMFLETGATPQQVRQLADDGVLECGYVPARTDECASLCLIGITEPEDTLLVVENGSPVRIENMLQRIRYEAEWKQRPVGELLTDRTVTDMRIRKISSPALSGALRQAFDVSSAVERMFVYDPKEQRFTQSVCPALAGEQERVEVPAGEKIRTFQDVVSLCTDRGREDVMALLADHPEDLSWPELYALHAETIEALAFLDENGKHLPEGDWSHEAYDYYREGVTDLLERLGETMRVKTRITAAPRGHTEHAQLFPVM